MLDALASLAEIATELSDTVSEKLAGELAEQIPSAQLNLVVAGQFKRGKSSLVNAFLGADLMPTGALPLTGVTTGIRYGDPPAVEVRMRHEGRPRSIQPSDLQLYVTEQFNPSNALGVERVNVFWPSERLRGLALFDTPGVGSVYEHNTAAAFAALPRADAALLVVGPEPPIGLEELEYARDIVASSEKLFVVLNKSDLAGDSLDEVLDFTRGSVARALSLDVEVIPVSATRARRAQAAGAQDTEFARLEATLRRFVDEAGESTRDASFRRRASLLAQRLNMLVSLRLSALRMPSDERRRRRGALGDALQTLDDRARPLELALDDDLSRLALRLQDFVERQYDRDLGAFKSHAASLASMRSSADRERRFEALLAGVVGEWRSQALALADAQLGTCAQKYARLLGEIERSIWKAGLEAANLGVDALPTTDIAFSPADLTLAASLVPTSGLELLIGFVVGALPAGLRVGVMTRRYERMLGSELDAAKGKLRYGISRDLDPWRRSACETIRSTIRHARESVFSAFEEADPAREGKEDETIVRMGRLQRRLEAVHDSIEYSGANGAVNGSEI